MQDETQHTAIDRIDEDETNVRSHMAGIEELAASIRTHGVIQPLVGTRSADGRIKLIAGHRRLAAAKLAGLDRVPLVIRGPGVTPGRSKSPVRLIDVAPTLLSLAGLQPIKDMLGVDLLKADIPPDRVRVIETYGGAVPGVPGAKAMMAARPPMRQSVTKEEWKLIIGGPGPELYNLANDPGELKNLIDEEKPRAEDMRKVIEEWDAKIPKGSAEAAELDGEDIEALKSLGYVE